MFLKESGDEIEDCNFGLDTGPCDFNRWNREMKKRRFGNSRD